MYIVNDPDLDISDDLVGSLSEQILRERDIKCHKKNIFSICIELIAIHFVGNVFQINEVHAFAKIILPTLLSLSVTDVTKLRN